MPLSVEATRKQGVAHRGFISHHSVDRQAVARLRVHLTSLSRAYGMAFWDDSGITAGSRWTAEIDHAISLAHVFLLCIGPDYLASDYLYDQEWPAIQRRVEALDGLIIPVVLRPCLWFGFVPQLQAVPSTDGRVIPISEWRPRDHGYAKAAEQIFQSISAYLSGSVFVAPPDPRPRVAPPPRSALPDGSSRFDSDEVERIVRSLNARRAAGNG